MYFDKKYVSIPYDFDMSGLVNASYAGVSGMENIKGNITMVTQRAYKGYTRDEVLLQEVRQKCISKKEEMFRVIDSLKHYFQSPILFAEAKDFVTDFFEIMESDEKFKKYIVDRTRTKWITI